MAELVVSVCILHNLTMVSMHGPHSLKLCSARDVLQISHFTTLPQSHEFKTEYISDSEVIDGPWKISMSMLCGQPVIFCATGTNEAPVRQIRLEDRRTRCTIHGSATSLNARGSGRG
jgi:hypothetical protein